MLEVFISDLHLKDYSLRKEIQGDTYYSLEQCIDFCINNTDVVALHILGDLFDVNLPSASALACFISQINRLPSRVKVYAIEGQHDRSVPPWFTVGSDKVIHASKIDNYTIQGRKAIAFDQMPKELIREAIVNIPTDKELLVLHQWFKSQLSINWNVDEEDIPEYIKLVLAGDLHKPLTWQCNKTTFAYCGSIAMQKIDETEHKSFIVLDNALNIKRIPLKTRPIWRAGISNEKQLEEYLAEMPQKIKEYKTLTKSYPASVAKPIFYVKYPDHIKDAHTKIIDAIKDQAHLYTNILIASLENTIELEAINNTLLECLQQFIDPKKEKELYNFVINLLTHDTKEIIKITKQTFI